jgi:hypothetical protein
MSTSGAADSNPCSCGIALESRLGQAYNEEAFRYFLAIERKRSRRSGWPFVLLLVRPRPGRGAPDRIHPAMAMKLFTGLWRGLRETDQIGWFREGRVAGALLTRIVDPPGTDIVGLVREKIRRSLCDALPAEMSRLEIRAFRLPSGRRILNFR